MMLRAIVIPRMKIVGHLTDKIEEIRPLADTAAVAFPIGGMQILDHIGSTGREFWEKHLKAGADVLHHVAAIVEHHIHAAHFFDHAVKEGGVVLRSDPDLSGDAVISGAGGVYVDAEEHRVRAKELAPHRQRP